MCRFFSLALKLFLLDNQGDMAEKAVVMVAIIIVSLVAWQFLGGKIARLVNKVGGSL